MSRLFAEKSALFILLKAGGKQAASAAGPIAASYYLCPCHCNGPPVAPGGAVDLPSSPPLHIGSLLESRPCLIIWAVLWVSPKPLELFFIAPFLLPDASKWPSIVALCLHARHSPSTTNCASFALLPRAQHCRLMYLVQVVLDLSIFGTIHVVGFFTYLTLAEGGSWQVRA